MASPSKEERILRLILGNSPLREWHFEEVVRQAHVTRAVANKWLKRYVRVGLLQHRKERGRFPCYTAGAANPVYLSWKRRYALNQLYGSGLIQELLTQERARTIIVFGSFAKGDWYNESDIDIFIYGEVDLDKAAFARRLGRHIELHVFGSREEMMRVRTGLLRNVMNAYLVKGEMQDVAP